MEHVAGLDRPLGALGDPLDTLCDPLGTLGGLKVPKVNSCLDLHFFLCFPRVSGTTSSNGDLGLWANNITTWAEVIVGLGGLHR